MKRRATQGKERGMVLVTTLLILSVVLLLDTAAVLQSTTDLRISSRYKTAKQAFYAAEAGINLVTAYYTAHPDDFKSKFTAERMSFPATPPESPEPEGYAVWGIPSIVYDTAAPPAWAEIRSRGIVPGTRALAEITARIGAIYHSPFSYGLFGDQSVAVSGPGYVDSYHSGKETWSQEGRFRHGDIGTNGTRPGAITLSGQGAVYGSALIGPGGNPDTDITAEGQDKITGRRTVAPEAMDMTPRTDPGGGECLSLGDSTMVSTGVYRLAGLQLSSQKSIDIGGTVTFLIDGDIRSAGRLEIRIHEGASLTMIVSGDIEMAGKGIINESGVPARLQIYGTSACRNVRLSGQEALHAVLYAPAAAIAFTGQADVFGAFAGKEVRVTGQGNVHYDEALKDLGGGNRLSGLRTLWWKDHAIDFY